MMDIKEIRKCLNMTQKEFSAFTQIPLRTLQGWEYEERKAPVYVIKLLEENLRLKGVIKDTDFVDDIVKNMKNPHLLVSSVNEDEYKDIDEDGVGCE